MESMFPRTMVLKLFIRRFSFGLCITLMTQLPISLEYCVWWVASQPSIFSFAPRGGDPVNRVRRPSTWSRPVLWKALVQKELCCYERSLDVNKREISQNMRKLKTFPLMSPVSWCPTCRILYKHEKEKQDNRDDYCLTKITFRTF